MATRRVRVGSVYEWSPVYLDLVNYSGTVAKGQHVRVVNKYGCPKANTMGHCYIQHLTGKFIGLVCTNSLQPIGGK